jgi:hypothetical protein
MMAVAARLGIPLGACSMPTSIMPLQAVANRLMMIANKRVDFMGPPGKEWVYLLF